MTDKYAVWAAVYAAAMQGCAAKYGAIDGADHYEILRKFCEKSASDAANAELNGKGLSMSPAEAIANARQAAFDKYQEKGPERCVCGALKSEHTPERGCVKLFNQGPSK